MEQERVPTTCRRDSYAGVAPSYQQKQNRADGTGDSLDASWNLQLAACLGGQPILATFKNAARHAVDSRLKEGVMMKPKMRLTLLACALGTASIATAQTAKDIPAPNDVIRLPSSVTTPIMPVVVSPPRDDIGPGTAVGGGNSVSRQAPPVVRSLGSEATVSDDDTLIDGGVDTTKGAAPTGQAGIFDTGDRPSNNAGTRTDTGADSGATPGTDDTSNMAGQNNQPGNAPIVPGGRPGVPRTDAPANAPGASSGN